MVKIEIYTKFGCPYCQKAKDLLRTKGLTFTEYDIYDDVLYVEEAAKRAHLGKEEITFPQIFFNDKVLGGCEALEDLEAQGKLDTCLRD